MNIVKPTHYLHRLSISLVIFLMMVHFLSATETPPENKSTPPSTTASLVSKKGSCYVSGRQLIVDGKPYIMKGMCYNPVAKGKTHPEGLIIIKPSLFDLMTIEHDFKMMHEAGVNTIRTYEPITDSRILNLLTKYQLRTIVPISSNCKEGLYDFASTINILKNHPSTLIWEIGNEWNNRLFYSTEFGWSGRDKKVLKYGECINFVKDVSTFIRSKDTSHPIATSFGDIPRGHGIELSQLAKSVDLYGVTVYDGLTFGDRFAYWKTLTDKPLFIDECGSDAFNTLAYAYDPKSQAVADNAVIKEAFENLSAKNPNNVLVGICIFEWCDEWWKDPDSSPNVHGTGGFPGYASGPYPDHYYNEEWFGVVDIDRHPRPAYDVVKQLYQAEH